MTDSILLTLSIGIIASVSKKELSKESSGGGGGIDESGRMGISRDDAADMGGEDVWC